MKNLRTTSANFAGLTADLRATNSRLTALVAKVDSGGGSLAKVLNDPGLYNDMRALIQHGDSLVADIKKNPRKYINVRVF